jgi:hypothetical protein
MTTKALIAIACPPNAFSKIHKTGHDIYHHSCSYVLLCQSMIGKFIIAERSNIMAANDLKIILIICHLIIINNHAKIHITKNNVNHTAPNHICAYFCKNKNVGDPSAKKKVKK